MKNFINASNGSNEPFLKSSTNLEIVSNIVPPVLAILEVNPVTKLPTNCDTIPAIVLRSVNTLGPFASRYAITSMIIPNKPPFAAPPPRPVNKPISIPIGPPLKNPPRAPLSAPKKPPITPPVLTLLEIRGPTNSQSVLKNLMIDWNV